MSGAVRTVQPRSVHADHHRQALESYVVKKAVVSSLKEGRVNGDERPASCRGEPRGESQRVIFGNALVEESGRESVPESAKPRPGLHCRRHGADFRMLFRDIRQYLTESPGKVLFVLTVHFRSYAVIFVRVILSGGVTLSLFGLEMDDRTLVLRSGCPEHRLDDRVVVSVARTDIEQSQILKIVASV